MLLQSLALPLNVFKLEITLVSEGEGEGEVAFFSAKR